MPASENRREFGYPCPVLFPSAIFLFAFLPALLLVYYLAPGALRNSILLLASLLFYAWGETIYVLLMLLAVGINYAFGLAISASSRHRRRLWVSLAVATNLSLLGWFKYANFLVENLNRIIAPLGLAPIELDPVHLPLGISFFLFQALSYVVDVYRGTCAAQRRPDRVALYISLFPQLIAGPIVRYHDVAQQLVNRLHDSALFVSGARRFVLGLAKKLLIANTLGEVADSVFATPTNQLGTGLAWLGIVCYALQIYFDFSAYSDMAIGLGRMFGFRFLENFNYPYIARSLREFWRRWHISLSRWFRDYLYIPLGGNRGSAARTYTNLCIVFLLCGLWHGASWNYIVWGGIHGTFLALERAGLERMLARVPAVIGRLYTLLVVLFAWVYFRAENLQQANEYLLALLALHPGQSVPGTASGLLTADVVAALVAGILFSMPVYRRFSERWIIPRLAGGGLAYGASQLLLIVGLLVVSTAFVAAGTYNPFIYFRF